VNEALSKDEREKILDIRILRGCEYNVAKAHHDFLRNPSRVSDGEFHNGHFRPITCEVGILASSFTASGLFIFHSAGFGNPSLLGRLLHWERGVMSEHTYDSYVPVTTI